MRQAKRKCDSSGNKRMRLMLLRLPKTEGDCGESEGSRQSMLKTLCSSSCTASSGLQLSSSIIKLTDPASSQSRHYLFIPAEHDHHANLFEIQSLSNPRSPTGPQATLRSYGSYFVDSTVVTNGEILLSSRIDPLFLILPILANGTFVQKWSPLDQIIMDVPLPLLLSLKDHPPTTTATPGAPQEAKIASYCPYSQLLNLLQVTNKFGNDLLLYKFSTELTLKWLVQKHFQIVTIIKKRMLLQLQIIDINNHNTKGMKQNDEHGKLQDDYGNDASFCNSFTLPSDHGELDDHEEGKLHGDCATMAIISPDKTANDCNHTARPLLSSTTDTSPPPTTTSHSCETSSITSLNKKEEQKAFYSAFQLISDYLSEEWKIMLAKELNLTTILDNTTLPGAGKDVADTIPPPSSSQETSQSPPSTTSNTDVETNKILEYTMGVSATSTTSCTSGILNSSFTSTKKKEPAQSAALKRLAKVKTKGIKHIGSFFTTGDGGGGGGNAKKVKTTTAKLKKK